jgi:hypothetical protein
MSRHVVRPLTLHINVLIHVTESSCVWLHARLISGTVQ